MNFYRLALFLGASGKSRFLPLNTSPSLKRVIQSTAAQQVAGCVDALLLAVFLCRLHETRPRAYCNVSDFNETNAPCFRCSGSSFNLLVCVTTFILVGLIASGIDFCSNLCQFTLERHRCSYIVRNVV